MSATRRAISGKSVSKIKSSKSQWSAPLRQILNSYLLRHIQAALLSLGQITAAPLTNAMIVLVIAIALAFPTGLFLLLKNTEALGGQLDNNAPILLYLKKNVTDTQAQALSQQLLKQEKLVKVTYISPAQGLKKFRQQSGLGPILDLVTENPLPGLLVLTPDDSHDLFAIKSIAASLNSLPEVEAVRYDEDWIQRLATLISLGKHLLFGFTLLLSIGVLVIVGSTIHLATESHREEIMVYQLVGASAAFIRRPFLYRGIWYGLLGALLALIGVNFFLLGIGDSFQQFVSLFQGQFQLLGLGVIGGIGLVCTGIILGWLGSLFAVWRQYRV